MKPHKKNFKVNYSLLNRPDSDRRCPVVIRSRQNSQKEVVKFIGTKASVKEWDRRKGRYKHDATNNQKLNDLEKRIQAAYRDLIEEGRKPQLTDMWDLIQKPGYSTRPEGDGVIMWIDEYLLKSKDSEGKKKGVRTVRSNILTWNPNLNFGGLSAGQLTQFVDWLNENNVANNSAYKRIRSLTVVGTYASQFLDVKEDLFRYSLPYATRNGSSARLSFPEVQAIMSAKAQGVEAIAKDVFLIACFTGLRISDILTIQEAEIHDFHIEKFQKKTGNTVAVTLHKYNEELIRKYHSAGIPYTRQTLSAGLKEVFQRASLTGTISKRIDRGSKTIMLNEPKYKLISFHSGRRFYARLLNDLGLGMEIARDELGHSARNITEHYAGSPEHTFRISRVREALSKMEKTMKKLALMKVA